MELGPEDVSLLERCPHFKGWYVQASMELEPEDVSLLERCTSSFQRVVETYPLFKVGSPPRSASLESELCRLINIM